MIIKSLLWHLLCIHTSMRIWKTQRPTNNPEDLEAVFCIATIRVDEKTYCDKRKQSKLKHRHTFARLIKCDKEKGGGGENKTQAAVWSETKICWKTAAKNNNMLTSEPSVKIALRWNRAHYSLNSASTCWAEPHVSSCLQAHARGVEVDDVWGNGGAVCVTSGQEHVGTTVSQWPACESRPI